MSISGGGCGSLDKATKAYAFEYQEPATLSQAAPVQNTWYTIIDETGGLRVYDITVAVEATGETLEVQATIDGELIEALGVAVGAAADFRAHRYNSAVVLKDYIKLITYAANAHVFSSFLFEGHAIKIEARKTTNNGAGILLGIVQWGEKKPLGS